MNLDLMEAIKVYRAYITTLNTISSIVHRTHRINTQIRYTVDCIPLTDTSALRFDDPALLLAIQVYVPA